MKIDLSEVDRLEILDTNNVRTVIFDQRIMTRASPRLSMVFQDNNRTLKLFCVERRGPCGNPICGKCRQEEGCHGGCGCGPAKGVSS